MLMLMVRPTLSSLPSDTEKLSVHIRRAKRIDSLLHTAEAEAAAVMIVVDQTQ